MPGSERKAPAGSEPREATLASRPKQCGVEPDRSGFIEINRTSIRTWEWGDIDAPAVICVHGAHDHGRMFDDLTPRIADLGKRVVAIDVRGNGDSGRLASGQTWVAAVLDLGALAQHLGAPVGIVAHSMGAGMALHAAAVFPELFRWVISLEGMGPPAEAFDGVSLADAAARGISGIERARAGRQRVWGSKAEMADRRGQTNTRLPREWLDHLVEHGAREVDGGFQFKTDPLFNVGMPDSFDIAHLEAEMRMSTRPVLIVVGGQQDTWSETPPEILEERTAWFGPQARLVVIDDAGHYPHLEHPDETAKVVLDYITEVES